MELNEVTAAKVLVVVISPSGGRHLHHNHAVKEYIPALLPTASAAQSEADPVACLARENHIKQQSSKFHQ